jgi:hypothetical protein
LPLNSTLLITGSFISRGNSPQMRETAERTSSSAALESRSSLNSAEMMTDPSLTWVYRCFKPCRLASAFSILRATSTSSWSGDAPGKAAVTVTIGRSMSGNIWIFIALKAITPKNVSSTKARIAGIGLRIDQDETLMAIATLSQL